MKVLAIGATGFIGRHVIRMLAEKGMDVAVLHRGKTGTDLQTGVQRIRGDRNFLDEVITHIARFAPDVVFDAILYTERQARELVEAFHGITNRLVALSSADVYRNYDGLRGNTATPPDHMPLAEDAPLRDTRYPYRGSGSSFEYANDYEKILVEQTLLAAVDLSVTVLRLPAVYGPSDSQHRLRDYLQRMMDGRPGILLQHEQATWHWSRGYVENVAAAITMAVAEPGTGHRVFNVGDEPILSEREWVERIGAVVGWRGAVVAVPAGALPKHLQQTFDWRYELWTDTSRIRKELGFAEPIPLDVALERTVERERSTLNGIDAERYREEDAVLQSRLDV